MGIYYHIYVECHTREGWVVPSGFEPEPWAFKSHRDLGEFAFARPNWGWVDLFWGPASLFLVHEGPPEDRRGSALFRYLDTFFDYERDGRHLYWLPYEELLIDSWDTVKVLVRAKVAARYALFFGDGRQLFPVAELLAAGMMEDELPAPWSNTGLTTEPVNMSFGPNRFRVTELPPQYEVEVTWQQTISDFMGQRDADAFRRLRRYGSDEELRLLATTYG